MKPLELRDIRARYVPLAVILLLLGAFVAVAPSQLPASAPNDVSALLRNGDELGTGGGPPGSSSAVGGGSADGTSPAGRGAAGGGGGGADGIGGAGPGGVAAAVDCSRNAFTGGTSCKPAWSGGSNGGPTYGGVTADQIKLVFFLNSLTAQGRAIAASTGGATPDDYAAVLPGFLTFFNKHFQTYGRTVTAKLQEGPTSTSASDTSGDQSNADVAVKENKAFAVVTPGASVTFHAEMARLRQPMIGSFGPFTNDLLDQWAPYSFVLNPSADVILGGMSDYYCSRLAGKPAEFAGDTATQAKTRTIGLLAPAGGGQDAPDFGALGERYLRACGSPPTKVINYDSDVSVAAQTATNAMAQMKAAGVTTVTCYCAGVAGSFFTNAAEQQDYHPEWLHSGFPNPVTLQRTASPAQWARSFGLSSDRYPDHAATTDWWRSYYSVVPPGQNKSSLVKTGERLYLLLISAFSAIENAGPGLTATSFASGLFAMPPLGGTGTDATYGFGPKYKPSPPYSPWAGSRDFAEVWWCGSCTGEDGNPGTVYYVNGGKRFRIGSFPTGGPDVFRNDGSPQPTPDPDR